VASSNRDGIWPRQARHQLRARPPVADSTPAESGVSSPSARTADDAATRIARLRRLTEEDPGVPPSVFGMLAIAATIANEPAETAAQLALRALDGAPKLLPEAVDRPPFFYHACISLTLAERHGEALARLDEALANARRLGSLRTCSGYPATAALPTSRSATSPMLKRTRASRLRPVPGLHAAVALAVPLVTLAERGEFDAAEAADDRYRLAEQFPTMVQGGWLLAARGRLRLAESRPALALGDLLAAGDLFARLHSLNRVTTPWRSDAALAHLALGTPAEARPLAAEEIALARAYHGPRAIGVALRAAGLAEGGKRGIEPLREAVRVLEGFDARLEHARAMADLGAALRRAGHRAESREILRSALELALRSGGRARARTERACTELITAGGRPRRLVLSGLDSLTPSERRIAQLAAAGLSNRDIAKNLFITARTVEGDLTHAYQKLAITSREQLPAALTLRWQDERPGIPLNTIATT
jgi:DNA-binding CsgD family transcriptional regulator